MKMFKRRGLFTRIWPGDLQLEWTGRGRCPGKNNDVFMNNNELYRPIRCDYTL